MIQEKQLEQVPSLKRVQRLMKKMGLIAIIIKRFKPQNSHSSDLDLPNLLNQNFEASRPNEKWVADITYIHTIKDGWCYLASILDLYTHKLIAFEFSKKMDKSIVIKALDKAMLRQGKPEGVILHTDRGSQYTSTEYIVKTDT